MNRLLSSNISERQRLAELLRRCSRNLLLKQGIQVHGAVVKTGLSHDLMLNNDLIDMYAKCGCLNAAHNVFDKMLERNIVSWTAFMCGYVQNGYAKESLFLFSQMGFSTVKPNEFTLSINLKACGMLNFLDVGMQIHCVCIGTGYDTVIVVANAVADMYLKCGKVEDALCMFENMPARNLISWNSIISGLSLAGFPRKALGMFWKMQADGHAPDEFTLTSVFKACRDLGAIREGSRVHALLITSGSRYADSPTIAGALIDLYVKCMKLIKARKVFDLIEQKCMISCSSLILGYAQEGNLEEAMNLYTQLREMNIEVDWFTLSSLLAIFADFALLEQGKQIHAYTVKVPSGADTSVRNSLMDMYMKCGMIDEAEKAFSKMPVRNVISWTVMITGYGKHGLAQEALSFFNKMQVDGIEPDDVTYLAMLLACSHSGLIEEGQKYFSRLLNDHNIKARVEHYACMVDLLGRAGRIKEAKNLVDSMPLRPNVGMWQTLLSACRVHKDVELGKQVGDKLLSIDCDNPVNYVMLSNMYADAGYWKECERLRELVKTKRLKKEAGCSWVEINKEVHHLYTGDNSHPLAVQVQELLKRLERKMKEELGYVYGVQYALYDIDEESKEESLRGHSEKLAIGLALICGGLDDEGKVIRVFKNLRICGDCHEFIKGLSKILKLVFVVRDANRFHRFEDGRCSCRDYW